MSSQCIKPRAQQCAVISVAIATILLSVLVGLWMCQPLNMDGLVERSEALRSDLQCLQCTAEEKNSGLCQRCGPGSPNIIPSKTTENQCAHDARFRRQLASMVANQTRNEKEKLNRRMSKSGLELINKGLVAQYRSDRIIMHWIPIETRPEGNSTMVVSKYERHRSAYTISAGPAGSHDNGSRLIVPKTGLYHVYSKLTFACSVADHKTKHVSMAVTVGESHEYSPFQILKERQRAKCNLKGDLVTLFQSGLFRIMKDSIVTLRYTTSDNVLLSSGKNDAFKSCLGMYRVGLA